MSAQRGRNKSSIFKTLGVVSGFYENLGIIGSSLERLRTFSRSSGSPPASSRPWVHRQLLRETARFSKVFGSSSASSRPRDHRQLLRETARFFKVFGIASGFFETSDSPGASSRDGAHLQSLRDRLRLLRYPQGLLPESLRISWFVPIPTTSLFASGPAKPKPHWSIMYLLVSSSVGFVPLELERCLQN